MIYWLIGAGMLLLLIGAGSRTQRSGLRWAAALTGLLLVAAGIASIKQLLGEETWYERSPMREFLLFFLMGAGMLGRMLSLAIEERRALRAKLAPYEPPPPLRIDRWDLIYPFLSATISFGALLQVTQHHSFDFATMVLAFQNGFFWQTVVGRAAKA